MSNDEFRPKAAWLIGRGNDCDLVVPEAAVSSRHCRLTQQGSGFAIEDLGSKNGTYVNGKKITPGQQVKVAQGVRVTLGANIPMPWPVASSNLDSGRMVRPLPQSSGRLITIGRDPKSDIQIDLPIVSWNHAVISEENGKYILEDRNSSNGTFLGDLSNRIQRVVLTTSDEVYLGSYKISAARLLNLETKVEIGEANFQTVAFQHDSMEAGRDPNCEIPLPDFPMVSWRHARFSRTPSGILVEDLGSRNGTYVNGARISGKVLAKAGQEIGLGSVRFQLMENGTLAQRDYNGKVTIEAKDIVVHAPNGKKLLDAVSLTVFPYELVALMGPAGAGKTTLLKALNGYTRPAQGTVLFRGQNLYDYYDLYRHMMGYVPQDDIVHPQLTVRQALYFSARLRTDLTDAEITTRTERCSTTWEFRTRSTLSSARQRRRLSAAVSASASILLWNSSPTRRCFFWMSQPAGFLLTTLSR
jgi:pSer/pThr/pTyr-binding forkhead associated (FHA) protein